jgi:uncharacterized protein YciI
MAYFVVNSYHGPAWQDDRPMRQQRLWDDHAAFMNGLPEGFVALGGPVGGGRRSMLIVKADTEAEVRAWLDPDPWVRSGHLVEVIEPWEILLGTP